MSTTGLLCTHGPMLALGATALLACGAAAIAAARSPVERRRHGILTCIGLWLYLAIAAVPLPRWTLTVPAPRPPSPTTAASPQTSVARAPDQSPAHPATGGTDLAIDPTTVPSTHTRREAQLAAVPPHPAPTLPAQTPLAQTIPGPTPPAPWPTTGELLAHLFVVGTALTCLRLLLGWLRLRWLLRHSRSAPAWLVELVPSRVRVRLTDGHRRPFCCGLLRPVVMLPVTLVTPDRAPAARAVLAHELAHVEAGDCRAQALFAWLLPLLWWHPLFWWVRAQTRFASERLADDAAAQHCGVRTYVNELLRLVDADGVHPAPAGAVSMFRQPSEFYRRIQMLLRNPSPLSRSVPLPRRLAGTASAALLAAITGGLCGVAPAQSAPTEQALRAESAELRKQVHDLQAELAALREQLEVQQQAEERARVKLNRLILRNADSLPSSPRDAAPAPAQPTSPAETTAHASPRQPQQPQPAASHSLTDLLNVVTRAIELRGELAVAKLECARQTELEKQHFVDSRSARVAAIKAETLQRQVEVAELLIRTELESAKTLLAHLEQLHAAGRVSAADPQLAETRTFVQVLSGTF